MLKDYNINNKLFICFLIFIFIFIINTNFIYANISEELGFPAVQAKYLDIDINIEIPVYISNYSQNNSFKFKTFAFYNSRNQDADFQIYYIDNEGEKKFAEIKKDDYGNDIAYFNVDKIKQSEYKFKLEGDIISENNIVLNTEKYNLQEPITNENSNENIEIYKSASQYIKSDHPDIINLSKNITKSDYALEELVNITNWVHQNVSYDLNYANVVLDSVSVLNNRKGVCDELAILEAAILRARGYPVKYVVGVANTTFSWGSHAWLEVYIPTQGWIPVDPTYNEVGLVDASHIILAKVLDPSDCEDKITTQSNINISFGNKETSTIINSAKSYSDLGYSNYVNIDLEKIDRLRANSLFKLTVNMKNTNANPTAFLINLLINEDFRLVKPKSSKEIIYLNPFEEKEYTYYIILPEVNNPMYYNYKLISQFSEIDDQVIIDPNGDIFIDAFLVLDPLYYFKEGQFIIDFDVINYTNENKVLTIKYDINSPDYKDIISQDINIKPMQEFNVKKDFNIDSGNILFSISQDYNYSKMLNIEDKNTLSINNLDSNGNIDLNENNSVKNNVDNSYLYIINKDSNKYTQLWEEVDNFSDQEHNKSEEFNILYLIIFCVLFLIGIILFVVFKK